jgi:hypothetical protein
MVDTHAVGLGRDDCRFAAAALLPLEQPVIDAVTWFGTGNSGSSLATLHTMSLNGRSFTLASPNPFGMITGTSGKVTLGTAFTLADSDAQNLVDLNVVLHIAILR